MFRPFIFTTPVRLQLDPIECGAVCLGMILDGFGRHATNYDLRRACKTSRQGSDAASIIEAAQQFDLFAKAKKCLASDLKKQRAPAILFFDACHFVVFEGYFLGKFYINDPARGRYALTYRELRTRFSNFLIALAKGEGFGTRSATPKSTSSSLDMPTKISSIVVGIFSGIIFVALAALFGLLVGNVGKSLKLSDGLLLTGLMMLLAWMIFGLWIFWLGITRSWRQMVSRETKHLTSSLTTASYGIFDEMPFSVARSVLASLPDNILSTVFYFGQRYFCWGFIVVVLSTSLMISSMLTIALFALLFVLILQSLLWAFISEVSSAKETSVLPAASFALDMRAMGQTAFVVDGLLTTELRTLSPPKKSIMLSTAVPVTIFLVLFFVITPSVWESGRVTLAEIFSVLVLAYGVLVSAKELLKNHPRVVEEGERRRTFEQEVNNRIEPITLARPNSQDLLMELKGVSFSYRGERGPVLASLSLTIRRGELIGLVGDHGSGKSTLLRLLGRKIVPTFGRVIHYSKQLTKLRVANLDRDADVMEASLRDNLTLFNRTIREGQMVDALKQACVLDLFHRRPLGLLVPILAHGANISLGEKKRLLLSQALLHDPDLILLDEFFDAIDEETALTILRNLRTARRTSIFTSFLGSELSLADRVIMLGQDNSLVFGTHNELLESSPDYRSLIRCPMEH
ncbi:MAG TPA: cysteine peptidase family C39 domain-containing protein [Myxococcota bacterium]|nr:cysteine peptidase family C39 domain-containing protein [Myxococcota bacterium]